MAADARSLARRVRLRARPCHGTSCVHRTGAAAARTWAGRARHAADRAGGRAGGHGGRRARPSYLRRRAEAGARARRRGSVGWVGPRLGERPLDPAWVAGFGSLSHKGWMCYVVCTGGNGEETTSSVLSPTCVTNLLKATILFLFIIYIYIIFIREKVQLGYGMEELIQMVVVPNAPNSV